MKVRESGMPMVETWESFFDPIMILSKLSLTKDHEHVLDFGCGYGTFSNAAATIINGSVTAIDLDDTTLTYAKNESKKRKLTNIRFMQRDFMSIGSGMADVSVDYAMLFNILHVDDPLFLLAETYRCLKPGGTIAILHWIHDANTPRGPSMAIRPAPAQCIAWAKQAGFELLKNQTKSFPPYHFGFVATKPYLNEE